jgi:hypothetical protein
LSGTRLLCSHGGRQCTDDHEGTQHNRSLHFSLRCQSPMPSVSVAGLGSRPISGLRFRLRSRSAVSSPVSALGAVSGFESPAVQSSVCGLRSGVSGRSVSNLRSPVLSLGCTPTIRWNPNRTRNPECCNSRFRIPNAGTPVADPGSPIPTSESIDPCQSIPNASRTFPGLPTKPP